MRRIPWAAIRRAILPATLLIAAITASMLAGRADRVSDPGIAVTVSDDPAAGSPILSARRAPQWLREPLSGQLLQSAIDNVIDQAPDATCLVLHRGDEVLAEHNMTASLRPGDLHRLITVAALHRLGGSGYRTEVVIDDNPQISDDGVLSGDIWIIGGGDPALSTRAYNEHLGDGRAFSDLDALFAEAVAELQSMGVKSIVGRVYGDETKYSPVERSYVGVTHRDPEEGNLGTVWTRADARAAGIGPLSGLLWNNGVVSWSDDPDEAYEVASNPALAAANLLDDTLEAAGFTVRRSPRAGTAPELADRRQIAVLDSPPLTEIMARSLVDATTAEMLLKEIGIRQGESALREEALFGLVSGGFTDAGLPYAPGGPVVYLDGSGTSDLNRNTCEMLFAAIDDADDAAGMILPAAAQSTVAECAPAGDGELSVYASSDDTTTGLVGRYTAANGDVLAFVMMAEDPGRLSVADDAPEGTEPAGPYEPCNALQAALLATVTGYPYGPDIEELSPLDPVP